MRWIFQSSVFGFLLFAANISFAQEPLPAAPAYAIDIKDSRVTSLSSTPHNFKIHDEALFFTANEDLYSNRLFRLDKQNVMSRVLSDGIEGDSKNGHPFEFINNKVIYGIDHGLKAVSLESGQQTVLIPTSQRNRSYTFSFSKFNDFIYFVYAEENSQTSCIWRTDGTVEGTQNTSICTDEDTTFFTQLLATPTALFLVIYNSEFDHKIWIINQQEELTKLDPVLNDYANTLIPLADAVYFYTDTALWQSDGTLEGTKETQLALPSESTTANEIIHYRDMLIAGEHGLYKVSNNGQGTTTEIKYQESSEAELKSVPSPRKFKQAGDIIFFFSQNSGDSSSNPTVSLMTTDGTDKGTALVHKFRSRPYDDIHVMAAFGNRIVFTRQHANNDFTYFPEIWVSDGTEDGTNIIGTFAVNLADTLLQPWAFFNERVYYAAPTESQGVELWQSDATEAGTFVTKDIGYYVGNNISNTYATSDDYLYFTRYNSNEADTTAGVEPFLELWQSKTNTLESKKIKDLNQSPERYIQLKASQSGVFFKGGTNPDAGVYGGLSFINSLTLTESLIMSDPAGSHCATQLKFTHHGRLYFIAEGILREGLDCQIWSTDGTPEGTHQTTNFEARSDGAESVYYLYILNDEVHFNMVVGPDVLESRTMLYKTDGTSEGTSLVFRAADFGLYEGAFISDFMETTEGIFYHSDNGSSGSNNQLWFWNGESARLVYQLADETGGEGSFSHIDFIGTIENTIYFSMSRRLWKSDGVSDGRTQLDFWPASTSFQSSFMMHPETKELYITTKNQMGDIALWGTENQVTRVKEIEIPEGYDTMYIETINDGKLYLRARESDSLRESFYVISIDSEETQLLYRQTYSRSAGVRTVSLESSQNHVFLMGASSRPSAAGYDLSGIVTTTLTNDDLDNDGVMDTEDAFPLHIEDYLDTDNDRVGNNFDNDDDNDGIPDASDLYPLNAAEWADFDNDSIGDRADLDDDNDGVLDWFDSYPNDASRSTNVPQVAPTQPPAPIDTVSPDSGGGGGSLPAQLLILLILSLAWRKRAATMCSNYVGKSSSTIHT